MTGATDALWNHLVPELVSSRGSVAQQRGRASAPRRETKEEDTAQSRSETGDQARVREVVEGWTRAIASGDRTGILAHHATDLLMFDFTETVRGIEAYDKTWDFFFAAPKGTIRFTPRDIEVTAGAEVAFATCHVRCEGTSGGLVELRLTVGLRKIDGEWTVTHEHHSVPSIEERFQPPE